jgi:peptidoglycan/LPS O-acetylase OafA/YrhL
LSKSGQSRIVRLFRRSTNSTNFIPEIDGLRFYAIFTVVIFHLNTAFSKHLGLIDLGQSLLGGRNSLGSPAWLLVRLDLGVKVFFAISGMVLALPFLKQYLLNGQKIGLKDYFYRRLTRLEPPFLLSLVMFFGVHVLLLSASPTELLPHFGAGILYAHVFIFGQPNPINPVTWSLETEAQFYLLVPLIFYLLFRKNNLGWTIFVTTSFFVSSVLLRSYFIKNNIPELGSSVIAYLSNFMIGIIFAWIYLINQLFFVNKRFYWDLIGFTAIFTQFYFYKPQHDYLNNIMFNLSILLMMFATFKGSLMNWFFTRPVIYIIGGMCYSIYLLHYAFFHLLVKYTGSMTSGIGYGVDFLIQILVGLPLVLMVSGVFYLLIEKPCMDKHWPSGLITNLKKKTT